MRAVCLRPLSLDVRLNSLLAVNYVIRSSCYFSTPRWSSQLAKNFFVLEKKFYFYTKKNHLFGNANIIFNWKKNSLKGDNEERTCISFVETKISVDILVLLQLFQWRKTYIVWKYLWCVWDFEWTLIEMIISGSLSTTFEANIIFEAAVTLVKNWLELTTKPLFKTGFLKSLTQTL
jgi:hypothetical protein